MSSLKFEEKQQVIGALVEGNSIRSIERMTGVHRDTIMRLMVRTGESCRQFMDDTLRDLPCQHVQVDEIWSYVGKKQRHVAESDDPTKVGDQWTYVALDAETKLVPAFLVGKRTALNTHQFITDLSSRLRHRVQLSSDALRFYVEATEAAFGADVDYGQIVKSYEAEPIGPGRYSPPKVVRTGKEQINGRPDFTRISTSHVERQNLTMRMSMRQFTRLTNAFSKKLENLQAAVGLHFAHYNFVRVHKTLKVTPAMQAGVSDHLWSIGELLETVQ